MTEEKGLGARIREWDERVDDDDSSDQMENMAKPFEGGAMLVLADLIEWDEGRRDLSALADLIKRARETAEGIIA